MPHYKVSYQQRVIKNFRVEADDEDDALDKVNDGDGEELDDECLDDTGHVVTKTATPRYRIRVREVSEVVYIVEAKNPDDAILVYEAGLDRVVESSDVVEDVVGDVTEVEDDE